jgi:major membrane immunogen (membrane-anchored lipoprotein)
MKTSVKLIAACIVLLSVLAFTLHDRNSYTKINNELRDSANLYLDGTFQGQSQSEYTNETYWGHIQITVEDGLFKNINFFIRDSNIHEIVDSMYGINHYGGNPTYQKQCVDDGNGIKTYPKRLLASQDLDNIDAISGATWAYNIFIASAKEALKDAKKVPNSINNTVESEKVSIEAYPNPFKSSLNFKYKLKKDGLVLLNIYDSQGNLVKKLVESRQASGNYSIQWQDCPSLGIYYYTLQVDGVKICRKAIKIE